MPQFESSVRTDDARLHPIRWSASARPRNREDRRVRTARRDCEYHFVSVWRVAGTIAEVRAVLRDSAGLPRWWPAVYLDVVPAEDGDDDGVGRAVELHTTGWLPYTLRWTLRVTEPMTDAGFAVAATGDLAGAGRWTFRQDGPEVELTYDWRVVAVKPLVRRLSWLLRPAFSANHHWAMARGEESLALELRRRRAPDEASRAAVPPPPGPTFRRGRRRGQDVRP
jgi:hypothetical protein